MSHGGKIISAVLAFAGLAYAAETPPSPPVPADSVISNIFNTVPNAPWTLSHKNESFTKSITPATGEAWDLRGVRALSVGAMREKVGPSVVRLRWAIKSRVGGMYVLSAPVVVPIASSVLVAVALDESSNLVPAGHQRPWDSLAAAEVVAIELRAECTFAANNPEEIRVTLSKATLEKSKKSPQPNAALLDIAVLPPPAGYRAQSQLTFRIDPMPSDPFESSGEGDVRVVLSGGAQIPAFLDQDYSAANDGKAARLVPVGRPYWRAILPDAPRGAGIEIRSGSRKWKLKLDDIEASAPAAGDAQNYGESAAGEPLIPSEPRWSVPLEINAPDVSVSCKGLPGPAELVAGAWQPATTTIPQKLWRPVPFWNGAWGDFGGAVRPNMILARTMDAALEQAAVQGTSKPMVILDGAMFEREGTFNWSNHPLKGQIAGPGELFRSAAGIEFCKRTMRYCMARWGLSKAVSGFWLTPVLNAPGASEFHAQCAPLLASWTTPAKSQVFSLHPFALAPPMAKIVATFEPGDQNRWQAERRASGTYAMIVQQDASEGKSCFEVRTADPRSKELSVFENFSQRLSQWKKIAADDYFNADALLFDVWTPAAEPPDLRVGIHLRDRDGLWYEALLYGMLNPGDWRTYALDLSGRNIHGLQPAGHNKAWNDYSRQRITEIGLHIYSTHRDWNPSGREPVPLQARFDNVRAVRLNKAEAAAPTMALSNPPNDSQRKELHVGELWQCHVTVSKAFANPFDAEQCDLSAMITTPSGKQLRVPAFFDQPCTRRELTPGGEESVEPLGQEFFTVRYRALEAGEHRVVLELREGGKYNVSGQKWVPDTRFSAEGKAHEPLGRGNWGRAFYNQDSNGKRLVETIDFSPGQVTATLKLGDPAFVVSPRSVTASPKHEYHGFVRLASDNRHFQFDDGTFFYPIGPCLRSPSDTRIPYMDQKWNPQQIEKWSKRGTYQYDDYFEAFEKAGINWARVWMCSWWGALEWRRDWPGFQGVGRYNLLNAWRIDHMLDDAEKRGIYIDLCLTNHGQFSLFVDTEWHNNPYSVKLGGPLTTASEFFTRADTKIAHQNKLRYCVARWGHSPAVMGWSLFSEIEWTEEYEPSFRWNHEQADTPAPNIESWHTEMAGFLKAIDPNKHIVGTHFSHPVRGEGTLSLPALDYATSNAYSAFDEFRMQGQQFNAPFALSSFWSGIPGTLLKGFSHFNKPALVEEHGRHWAGGRENTPKEKLEADHHCGLWGALMQPLAGATGYWWWLHLHYDNRYGEYEAIAKYIAGEDFRPGKDEPSLEPTFGKIEPENRMLGGRAMKSDRRMYLWIYDLNMPTGDAVQEVRDGKLTVKSLRPGKYHVEFWNTRTGTRFEERDAELKKEDGQIVPMSIPLPVFKGDIALKIKPKD